MTKDEIDGLIERLRNDADERETITYNEAGVEKCLRMLRKSNGLEREAAAALEAQRAEIERLRDGGAVESISAAAVSTIRALLNHHGVPQAAFIDDHVRNALFQRKEAISRARAAGANVDDLTGPQRT